MLGWGTPISMDWIKLNQSYKESMYFSELNFLPCRRRVLDDVPVANHIRLFLNIYFCWFSYMTLNSTICHSISLFIILCFFEIVSLFDKWQLTSMFPTHVSLWHTKCYDSCTPCILLRFFYTFKYAPMKQLLTMIVMMMIIIIIFSIVWAFFFCYALFISLKIYNLSTKFHFIWFLV